MALIRAIRRRLQWSNAPASNLQQPPHVRPSGSKIAVALAATAAAGLVISSALFGAIFAWQVGLTKGPIFAAVKADRVLSKDEVFLAMLPHYERMALGVPALEKRGRSYYADHDLLSLSASQCYSCGEITLWRYDAILYPPTRYEIEPNPDLPDNIRADFDEARTVLDLSPRSAAALLRLCIQKLCKHLGESGENLNKDIGSLVSKGLNPLVQKALDIVRVVGNNAVHPGELDLCDDRVTAAKLFELVNLIASEMITRPKEIDALFDEKVPQGVKDQIIKRDGQTGR